MDSPTKGCPDGCDPDFIWEDYLEDTKSIAAPPTAFFHVEHSLVSNLKIGMKLEVVNLEEENSCYWVASVVMICGPLLSMRYLGYGDERTADFWCDLKTGEFHPVGWCCRNNAKLYPPKGVRDRQPDYMSLIVPSLELDTIPVSILEDPESGITPIDQIKPEMLVEVEDEHNYDNVWPARIVQNVGGRLLLRYESNQELEDEGFWLFYLSERVHAIGWAKENGRHYQIPEGQNSLSEDDKKALVDSCFKEAEEYPFPAHILEPQLQIPRHGFQENMKLEMLNPLTLLDIKAATVTRVINDRFFVVEVDNMCMEAERAILYPSVCCHAATMTIFPCMWASENGLTIRPPEGYSNCDVETFDWGDYLLRCEAIAAPRELFCKPSVPSKFEKGMKLEAVNIFSPDEIHAATIGEIIGPLLWIQFDSVDESSPHHVVTVNSSDVLPVGWCASNGYPLKTPALSRTQSLHRNETHTVETSLEAKVASSATHKESSSGKSWCPKIYFNHCCFTGPLLSKSRLAELPQAIGPGPLHLVMQDVLTRLINIAYKSCRVLKELQISGRPDPKMLQQTIKAKYKGKSYRATVEFIRNSEEVEDFCRKICKKLDCCPHLFGPNHVGQDCPDKCSNLTKTKFGNGFVRRVKKPNGSTEESHEVKRGPGRRKKRKHWRLIHAERKEDKESQDASGTSPKRQSPKTSDSEDDRVQRKKIKEGSDSESKVVTRGSKFPESQENYAPDSASSNQLPESSTDVPVVKKKGRPVGSTKKAIAATLASKRLAQQRETEAINKSCRVLQEAEQIGLPSNPLKWTVEDVVKYVKSTPCAPVAYLLREQEIDGQALLMLTLYSVQEFLHLKPDPAKVFCTLVEKIKYEFFMKFT